MLNRFPTHKIFRKILLVCVCVDVARIAKTKFRFYMKLSSRVVIIPNQSFLVIKKGVYLDRQINELFLCQTSIKESANSS